MRLEQLTIILEVARVGSMSQAAKNLSFSQPSLSTALASLKKSWGSSCLTALPAVLHPPLLDKRS